MTVELPAHLIKHILKTNHLTVYQNEQLPLAWIELMKQERFFHLFVPVGYGGHEASISEGVEVIYKLGVLHGALGWVVNLGAGAGFFSRSFDHNTAQAIFDNPDTVLAGSGDIGGMARHINGKYIISGKWGKCSGAAHASHFTFNAQLRDGEISSFILPKSEVELVSDWPIFGLKPTSSFGMTIDKKIVSGHHKFSIHEVKNHRNYSTFQLSFDSFARLCMSAAFMGIVGCFVRHYEQFLEDNQFSPRKPFVQLRSSLNNAVTELFRVAEAYTMKPDAVSTEQHHELVVKLPAYHKSLFMLTQEVYLDSGIMITQENNCVHQAWRDVTTGIQHFMV
jgi:indole-3-acetate monooxygenase